ncbi:Nitrite reductase (NO-forming) [Lentibacillus sp. JNUCC-1]|nr:Nitrite reductase (NO-forming) [Lentibacillus sp. JNUCC-1]
MFGKMKVRLLVVLSILVLVLTACAGGTAENTLKDNKDDADMDVQGVSASEDTNIIEPHKDLNDPAVPLEMERDGTDVYVTMTAQITDIEIEPGYDYKAWTFNGEAPGPLIVVEEGDTIHFTLENKDPSIPHSMDFHAVHTAPDKNFIDVMPNEEGTFSYDASNPGSSCITVVQIQFWRISLTACMVSSLSNLKTVFRQMRKLTKSMWLFKTNGTNITICRT